ncbi:hypothetical protein PFISCL1PPCAC_12362, partial [Pristionchus fissidentatus]
GGGGYGAYDNGGYAQPLFPRGTTEVSFDTSAKDPHSVRSRIFIGSLSTAQTPVTREHVIELCSPFGPIRGVTFFKMQGYAFVQLDNPARADSACRALNGIGWKGCQIDVHLVGAQPGRGPGGPGKRGPPPAAGGPAGFGGGGFAGHAGNNEEISRDTSSKDPKLLRARVFIGSLGRNPISRDDIIGFFRPFGKITAVTLFKGYAFVQFASPVDAVNACEKLNGKMWMGSKVDVHLAMEGSNRKRNTDEAENSFNNGNGNSPQAMDWTGSAAKKAKEEEEPQIVVAVKPVGPEIICTACRFCCSDLAEFKKHRKNGACSPLVRTGEPPCMSCAQCDAVLPNAWQTMFHLMDEHKLKLVTADSKYSVLAKTKTADEKNRAEWWASVEKWLDGLPKQEEGEVDEEETDTEGAKSEDDMQVVSVLSGATIVCGQCRLVTEDWEKYKEHKKMDCIKPKDQTEPAVIVCAMCHENFSSAWKAIFHLIDFHRMKLFTPEYTKESMQKAAELHARTQLGVEKRMKTWMETHCVN